MIINATNIGERISGLGRFSLILAKHFLGRYRVIVNEKALVHFSEEEAKNLTVVSKFVSPDYGFMGHLSRLIYTNTLKGPLINLTQMEVSFFTNKQIVVVHDLIPLIFPEYHSRQYFYFKYILPYVLKNKTCKIITVSNHTKELLISYYGLGDGKITVIYNGVEIKTDNPRSYNERDNIILFAGRDSPTKNIDTVLESFIKIHSDKRFKDFNLIVAGVPDKKRINHPNIKFLGYVSQEVLDELYSKSKLFIYPSLYEGFGFPPLEAMSYGTPVICSNVSSLPEVVKDGAITVDPKASDEIADKAKYVLGDQKVWEEYSIKGFKVAREYSWEKSLSLYEEVFREFEASAK